MLRRTTAMLAMNGRTSLQSKALNFGLSSCETKRVRQTVLKKHYINIGIIEDPLSYNRYICIDPHWTQLGSLGT